MPNPRHAPEQARRVDQPMAGYYRMRLAKGGWAVPCRIGRDADGRWFAVIDGFEHAADADPWRAEGVSTVHTYGLLVTEDEYVWCLAIKKWARENHPSHPALWPQRGIDVNNLRPIMPRTLIPDE